jgi:hypothetical protein
MTIRGTEAHTMIIDDIIPTKLRLMVTRHCNRNCPQCCNKSFNIDEDIPLVNGIAHYEEILLTGGEPMLDLEYLVWLIETIRDINPTARIIVYTSYFENPTGLLMILNKVDGLTVTLHDLEDLGDFMNFHSTMVEYGLHEGKSLRLNYFPEDLGLRIYNSHWHIKELEWLDNCPIPAGEDFRRLYSA